MKIRIIPVLLFLMLISACSAKPKEPIIKPLSNTVSDLNTTLLPTLEIAKAGEGFYKATPELTRNIIDLLSATTPVGLDTPGGQEDDSSIDMKDYTYVLRFSGHNDIRVYSYNDDFAFVNDRTKIYTLCWNVNYKLDLLKKEIVKGTEMYTGYHSYDQFFKLAGNDKKMTSYTEDLNGDGIKDTFSIGFDGDLSAKINGKECMLGENLSYYGDNSQGNSGLSEPPEVNFLDGEGGTGKLIVITIMFQGADNFHVEQWTLKLEKDGKLVIKDFPKEPKILSDFKNNILSVRIPEYSLEDHLKLTREELQKKIGWVNDDLSTPTVESVFDGKGQLYFESPTAILVEDYNGDGKKDIFIDSDIVKDFRFPIEESFTFYKYSVNGWKFSKILTEKDFSDLEWEILIYILYHGGIKEIDSRAEQEPALANVSLRTINKTLNIMIEKRVLIDKGGGYYINY